MVNLKKYYEFFSKNRYSNSADITFFKDGSFAIYNNGLDIYDETCNLVATYNQNALLCKKSGVVVVIENGVGFKAYYKGEEIVSIKDTKFDINICHSHGYGFYLAKKNCCATSVYFIERTGIVKITNVPYCFYSKCSFTTDEYGNTVVVDSMKAKTTFFNFDQQVLLDNILKVKLLSNNRAIISTRNGSDLIIYEGLQSLMNPQSILHSNNKSGIRNMDGDFTVVYQDALVADSNNGMFVEEYNCEKFVSPGGAKVSNYTIMYQDLRTFWPGGYFRVFEVDEEVMFVNFYDGRFYPFFIDLLFSDCILDANVDNVYSLKLCEMVHPE